MNFSPCIQQLRAAGISLDDASQLRRISMTLHRWFERECGDSDHHKSVCLVRGTMHVDGFEHDDDGEPHEEIHYHRNNCVQHIQVPDLEKGAYKLLDKIMAKYPALHAYIQTDPRGASLYILNKADIEGKNVESCYNRGIAVYK